MNNFNLLPLIIYNIFPLIGVIYYYRYKKSNPVFWYFIFHSLIASGSIILLDFDLTSDIVYYICFITSIVSFFIGSILSFIQFNISIYIKRYFRKPLLRDNKNTIYNFILLLVISILVTLIYYYLLGYNIFLNILLGNASDDVATARLDSYSGPTYFAPGYVNQFKNVILPITFSMVTIVAFKSHYKKMGYLLIVILLPIILLGLLGTGQRAFLIYAFASFVFGYLLFDSIPRIYYIVFGVGLIVLFGISSFYLGRIESFSFFNVVEQVFHRGFITEQFDSLIGFRYMYSKGIVYFSDWFQSIKGIMPNHSGSQLQHEIFYILHGTSRGTGAFSTVGSVYYNAGFAGIIILYLLKGYLYNLIFLRFLKGKKTIARSIVYGSMFFYLASFVSGDIMSLFNRGFITLIILMIIRKVKI